MTQTNQHSERERCNRNAAICRETADLANTALRFKLGTQCYREALEWDRRAQKAEDAAAALISHSENPNARLAEMAGERDGAKEALEIDDEMVKQKRERTETLLAKLDTDKSALEKLLAEIMGTVDELHEGQ